MNNDIVGSSCMGGPFLLFTGERYLLCKKDFPEMESRSRGLKHPKFWGFFSPGGNNGSEGLMFTHQWLEKGYAS